MTLERERRGLASTWDAVWGREPRRSKGRRAARPSASGLFAERRLWNRGPRSILQVVARQPRRYWRRRSPEVAAARKIADARPTSLRDDQNAKARRILGRRSRVTNSKATWRSAGRCNLDRLKSSNRPAATCLELSLADFLALARSVIQASRPAALRRVDQGKRPQRR